jgi:hypothetical protein
MTEEAMDDRGDLRAIPRAPVTWTESNGEVLLLDSETEEVFGLDHVGAAAFLRLAAGQPLSAVIAELQREYEVPTAVLTADLRALVEGLRQRNLVDLRLEP